MKLLRFLPLLATAILAGCGGDSGHPTGTAMVTHVETSPWSAGTGGQELTSAHYRIYTTATNRALVTYMPGFMEAAYANYRRLTGLGERTGGELMPIYLLASRQEWTALTSSVVGKNAGPYLQIQAGGYCYRGICVFWDIGNLGTFSVASHEGLHQFFHHRLRDRLPMWLEEGLATVAEGYEISGDAVTFTSGRNNFRFTDLRATLVQNRFLPLSELLSMDSGEAIGGTPHEAVGYYGQLWALIQFVNSRETYRLGMQRLLADAEAGNLGRAVGMSQQDVMNLRRQGRAYNKAVSLPLFRAYVSNDLAAFETEYRAFATKLARL